MTEQEITVRECLHVILTTTVFSEARTTWDHNIAEHARDVIAKRVADYYNMGDALNELTWTNR